MATGGFDRGFDAFDDGPAYPFGLLSDSDEYPYYDGEDFYGLARETLSPVSPELLEHVLRLGPGPRARVKKEEEEEGDDTEYQFVSEIPDELQCLICTSAARDPQQVDCCGKVFCRTCLRKLKRSAHRACPNCRKGKWKSFSDKKSE